ncbi:MAG: hypothetical protein ACRBM6_01260 [Geminicoccales bacterium]
MYEIRDLTTELCRLIDIISLSRIMHDVADVLEPVVTTVINDNGSDSAGITRRATKLAFSNGETLAKKR